MTDPEVIAQPLPSSEEVVAFRLGLRRLLVAKVESAQPFLILTPLGLPWAARLLTLLQEQDIEVVLRKGLLDWPRLGTALYASRREDEDAMIKAIFFEAVWRKWYPGGYAECWLLAGSQDYAKLTLHKLAVREQLTVRRAILPMPKGGRLASLHPFHVPDAQDLELEWAIMSEWFRRAETSGEESLLSLSPLR